MIHSRIRRGGLLAGLVASLLLGAVGNLQAQASTWEGLPLWRGDGEAVALSPTQSGWVALSVDHPVATNGRAAVYLSDVFGAEWAWDRFADSRGAAAPGSLHFLPSGRMLAGAQGAVNRTGLTLPPNWSALSIDGAGLTLGSLVHQFASARVTGSPVLIALRAGPIPLSGGVQLGSQLGSNFLDVTPPGREGHDGTAVAMHATDMARMAVALVSPTGEVSLAESLDGGSTWLFLHLELTLDRPVTALTYVGDELLAAVGGRGVHVRTADGEWLQVDGGSQVLHRVQRLHVSHASPSRVYAATATGLSVSDDAGRTWRHAARGTAGLNIRDVATTPLNPDVVLLAVRGVGAMASVDGGASFEATPHGIDDGDVAALAAHPSQPTHLAASVRQDELWRLVESFDAGEAWVMARAAPVDIVSLWFSPDGRLWAVARSAGDAGALYVREASGQWRRMGLGGAHTHARALAFADDATGIVWAGGSGWADGAERALAWRSSDGGASWSRAWMGPEGHAVASVALVPGTRGQHVLVSTDRQDAQGAAQLRFSRDGGNVWEANDWTTLWDWTSIELCAHSGKGGTAMVLFRAELRLDGPSTLVRRNLEHIAEGGQWTTEGGFVGEPLRSPVCRQEPDGVRLYVIGDATGLVMRSTAAGNLAQFGHWPQGAKRSTQYSALAINDSGIYVAGDRGVHRNRAHLQAPAPHITALDSVDARAQRLVTLEWSLGGEWVDVWRGDAVVASIRNTGRYSERLLRGADSPAEPAYQVCNRFTEACSDPVTLAP